MYFFFQFNNKVTRTTSILLGSPVHVLQIAYCDFENPTVYIYSITRSESVPKTLKPVAFLLEFSIIPIVFETSHRNKKNLMMSRKVGTFSKQNGISKRDFFTMRILYTKLQSYSLCYRQTKWYMQKIPCYWDYMCQVSKLQHMYVIGLILLSVLKTTKHTWLYTATHYCSRMQEVNERIAEGSVGMF